MKITINKKKYDLEFTFGFVEFVIDKLGYKTLTEYDAFVTSKAFTPETFTTSHYKAYAEAVLYSIEYTSGETPEVTLNDITQLLWQDVALFQKVVELFVKSQPQQPKQEKVKQSVNPAKRGK